ncbi:hypothetical protein TcBrA4_0117170 [Trypanosoma cruzi]|nr:hypothetical protein TcBrA4_0117170 [Trypanosoma cruzi]
MHHGATLHESLPCPLLSPIVSIDQCPFQPHERSETRPPHGNASLTFYTAPAAHRVNFTPGPNVTYSAENKYSWNPYYRLETENNSQRLKVTQEECNSASVSGPCPIALTPRQGQCMARCSNTSSSTAQSPMHTFGYETPAIVSRCELSPQFSSVKSESGRALLTASHSIEENSITESTCVPQFDNMMHGLPMYASIHPVGEVWPLNEMNNEENVVFDAIKPTRNEQLQQQLYPTPLLVSQNQPTVSPYPYVMESRTIQPTYMSYNKARIPLLRFSKMLPPPVRCEAMSILENENPQLPLLMLYNPVRRWYERIKALLNEDYSAWPGGSCAVNISNNKGVRLELEEPCPTLPNKAEQTRESMSQWLKECNEWWNRQFFEKSRNGDKRRNGTGRGKWRQYSIQYPYNNHNHNNNNNKAHKVNRGLQFDGEVAFLRRGGLQ